MDIIFGVDYTLRIKSEHFIVEEIWYVVDDLLQCLLCCMDWGYESLGHVIDRKCNYTTKMENSECILI